MDIKKTLKDLDSQKIPRIQLSYINSVPMSERPKITSSLDAAAYMAAQYDPNTIELFESYHLMCLSNGNRVLGVRHMADGGISGVLMCKTAILQTAILTNARCVILSHNHPSGKNTPSHADIKVTREIKHTLEVAGIKLLDHIIITPQGEHYSMLEMGDIS
jgi:DNA repair protein RadC